jgi:hypothetical protein
MTEAVKRDVLPGQGRYSLGSSFSYEPDGAYPPSVLN